MPKTVEPWSLTGLWGNGDQDRRQSRQPRLLRHVPDRRGRGICKDVQGNPDALGRRPHRREGRWVQMRETTTEEVRLHKGKATGSGAATQATSRFGCLRHGSQMELIAMDAASCSLPPSFPATQIDGHSYWYGGLWSNTPLCEVLNCLQKNPGSHTPKPMTRCLVFIVDLFAPGGDSPAVIRGNWDVWALRDRVLFQDKVWYDERSGKVNKTIRVLRRLRRLLRSLPPDQQKLTAELDEYVKRKYEEMSHDRRLRLQIHKFVRLHPESDEVSREIDFSPERINALIHQGRTEASSILAAIDRDGRDQPSPYTRPSSPRSRAIASQ